MNTDINPDLIYHQGLHNFIPPQPINDVANLLNRKLFVDSVQQSSMPQLVDLYYQIQNTRVFIFDHLPEDEIDQNTFNMYSAYLSIIEDTIVNIFKSYNCSSVTGNWSTSQLGVGEAFSASLLSLVDISKAPSVTNLWKYAGLDPKHTKWNALLKNISWKLGKSFEFYSNDPDCFYGKLYNNDLQRRMSLNENGHYASPESDKLSQERLTAQARRYSVKIFLSHWHHIRFREINGVDPMNTFKDSSVYITPPNFPF
jgi:hypothetical protein